jgi:peptidyl-prolyl cis-trans isomerase B (cyclophilin B)
MIKKIIVIILLSIVCVACTNSESVDNTKFERKIKVKMDIKGYGTISLELYPDVAPITVENFTNLVKSGFYDGLTFYRILDDFMIQAGDPEGIKKNEYKKLIKGEFEANGYSNPLKHERGVISMARKSNDYNSASSQFFIVQKTDKTLDGQYASFGRVTNGIEIVDKICKDTKIENSNGYVLMENRPVIEKVYLEE